MRIVFMGTPEFAVASLRALASAHEVVAVFTRADSASGRGGEKRPSPVKVTALELGLDLRQPATLRDPAVTDELTAWEPDLLCVAAYGLILPRAVLDSARWGAFNVHASLLPRWRGAAPIQRAILAGDQYTGVSIMRMEEGLDTGDYAEVVTVPTDEYSAHELTEMLAQLGAAALLRAIERLEDGSLTWTPQDEAAATYAPKIGKADVALEPNLTVADAARRVRASTPRAPARLQAGGTGLTVVRAVSAASTATPVAPGAVVPSAGGVLLGFSDGALELLTVKPDGKREMPANAWARGARLPEPAAWGPSS